MNITSDWHIHSRNSCDEAGLVVADLIRQAGQRGIRDFGLTDHLHTPFNLPDIEASRAEFLACDPASHFHFGIEVSVVSQWELDEIKTGKHANPVYGLRDGGPAGAAPALGITAEDIARYGVEYVVGGTHWPLYAPMEREAIIRDYHRQNMFLACHPLVDIVAHPWWWMGPWRGPQGGYAAEPWFDDFRRIPAGLHAEFAAAALRHGTMVEINLGAMLLNPEYPERFKGQYLEYLADLKARGVALCIGSDCHSRDYDADFATAAKMLAGAGFRAEDFRSLPPGHRPRAVKKGAAG